jgi:hypothetical protein
MTNKIGVEPHRAEVHAPAWVLEERERRREARLRQSDTSLLMGEPPVEYSALAQHRRAELDAIEAERIKRRQQAHRAAQLTALLRTRTAARRAAP